MKVIKLDRRFKVYKEGYSHAIRCHDWISKEARQLEKIFVEMFGYDWGYEKPYKSFYGKTKFNHVRPKYFAVKNEALITQVLLKLEN